MNIDGVNVDRLAREVLSAIEGEGDGMMDTTEVQELIKADGNKRVKYRFDKLEEAGLVEVERDRKDGRRSLPNQARITEEGENLVTTYNLEFGDADDPSETVQERVGRGERERAQLEEDFENLQEMLAFMFEQFENLNPEAATRFGVDPEVLKLDDRGEGDGESG